MEYTAHMFGTFDVGNYGDLLFPIIAQYKLQPHITIIPVSPTSNDPGYSNTIKPISINDIPSKTDAVLLGGGNILHLSKGKYGAHSYYGYSDVWFASHKLSLQSRAPHFYNNPGCMLTSKTQALSKIERKLIEQSATSTLKTSVRDSANLLNEITGKGKYNLKPDTAFHISKMWPCELKNNHISINLNQRYFPPAKTTAQIIDDLIDRTGQPIDFVIIGEYHGDETFTNSVVSHMRLKHRQIIRKDLKEIATNIASAHLFIGSSMHGLITALSYQTDAILVHQKNGLRKFESLWEYAELDNSHHLHDFSQLLTRIGATNTISKVKLDQILKELDNHWSIITQAIVQRTQCKPSIYLKWYRELLVFDSYKKKIFSRIIS